MSNQQPPNDPNGNQWGGVPPEGGWPQHGYGQQGYDQNQYDQNQYGLDQYGRNQYGQDQYGRNQYGQQGEYQGGGQPNYATNGDQGYGQGPSQGQGYGQGQHSQAAYGYQPSQGYAGTDANAGNPWQQHLTPEQPKRTRRWLIPVAAVAAVLLIGGAIWVGIALFSGQGRGAASAEEAVDKLISESGELDYLGPWQWWRRARPISLARRRSGCSRVTLGTLVTVSV